MFTFTPACWIRDTASRSSKALSASRILARALVVALLCSVFRTVGPERASDGRSGPVAEFGARTGANRLPASGGRARPERPERNAGASPWVAADPPASDEAWLALDTGLNGTILGIAVDGTGVYAGGFLSDAGGDGDADHIARWDGASWNALGSGLNDGVRPIAIAGTDIYAGG